MTGFLLELLEHVDYSPWYALLPVLTALTSIYTSQHDYLWKHDDQGGGEGCEGS